MGRPPRRRRRLTPLPLLLLPGGLGVVYRRHLLRHLRHHHRVVLRSGVLHSVVLHSVVLPSVCFDLSVGFV